MNPARKAVSTGRPMLFPAAFTIAALASLLPLWSVKYPPMVDLPQHAASVFIWKHYFDPAFGYRDIFAIDFFSPYVFGHGLARLIAETAPVLVAMKLVVSLALLALPVSLAFLLKQAGSDIWGAFLGFPFAYGFAFYWGFFNYLLAVPIGLLFVARGLDYAREPTLRRGRELALLAFAVYFGHALAFGLTTLVVGLLILLRTGRDLRLFLLRIWPLLPSALAVVLWVIWQRGSNPNVDVPLAWSESFLQRLLDFPTLLVGGGREGGERLWGGLLLLLIPLVGSRIRTRPWWRVAPFAVAAGLFLAAPNRALNTWFVYPRFAVFVGLFALLALEPSPNILRRRLGRTLILVLTLAWAGFLIVDFRSMDAEARRFDELLERMEGGKRVLGLNFAPGFEYVAGMPIFGHFHMWYQAQKGGIAEFTFGVAAPQLVHYRPGAGPLSDPALSLHPQRFDFRRDGHFDYFVVRAKEDLGPRLFTGAPVTLDIRAGDWWLYRRR